MITKDTFHKAYALLTKANEVYDEFWKNLPDDGPDYNVDTVAVSGARALEQEAGALLGVDYNVELFDEGTVSKRDFLQSLIDWEVITDDDILDVLAEKLL